MSPSKIKTCRIEAFEISETDDAIVDMCYFFIIIKKSAGPDWVHDDGESTR